MPENLPAPVTFITAASPPVEPWSDGPGSDAERAYLLPLIKTPLDGFVRNVFRSSLRIAMLGDALIPLTLSDFDPRNSYVVSPYTHYISYGGFEELHKLGNPTLETIFMAVLRPLARLFRACQFDRVVYANNWLLSTNLYPALDMSQVDTLARILPELFPDHAIVFRSVDSYRNPLLYERLLSNGYSMILSRQVYYQEPAECLRKKQTRIDLRLLMKSGYEIAGDEELSETDIRRLLHLYNLLYLEKYSYFNPQFSKAFVRHAHQARFFRFRLLRRAGTIDGVMGYYVRNGVMTQPIFGYDTTLSQRLGLYRLLSALTLLEGHEHGLLINASAGVGAFKRIRGGAPALEFNAVYVRHLPAFRQLPWRILRLLMDWIAVPLFRKYGF